MRSKYLRVAAVLGVITALALFAASVGTGGSNAGSAQATRGLSASNENATVHVNFVINRFVRQGRRIVAQGAVVAKYRSASQPQGYIVRKPFSALVKTRGLTPQSAQKICDVLDLTLGPLHLELLGLIVDLSRVHLTIKADSEGGILGSLFCNLAGGRGLANATRAKLNRTAAKMTRAVKKNGLNRGVSGFVVNISQQTAPTRICEILDLTLGPLDLNLLGLMVHLDRLRLHITADSEGGILGSLLCSLAGGGPPPPPLPPPPPAPGQIH